MIVYSLSPLPPLGNENSVRLDEVILAQPVEDIIDFDSPIRDGGATVAQQVCAKTVERKLGFPTEASRGLSKFGWLKALNISARSCSRTASVTRQSFWMPRSRFEYPGASKMLRPTPFEPGSGSLKALASANTTGPMTFGIS